MMMIAGLGRTEQAVAGAGWAMLMPMTMFGGGMMPQFIMPAWMQTVGNVSPVKWAILGFEGARVARLHAERDAAAVRDSARLRRGVFRDRSPRAARGVETPQGPPRRSLRESESQRRPPSRAAYPSVRRGHS